MAKDGTNRGGRRVRAGDKPLPLVDKIAAGKAARILEPANLRPEELLEPAELAGAAELAGEDMPAPGEYLSTRQKDGRPLGADALYTETWNWLRARGCEKLINPRLVEAYAQAFARFIQCEAAISTYGLFGKHHTTGGAITTRRPARSTVGTAARVKGTRSSAAPGRAISRMSPAPWSRTARTTPRRAPPVS